MFAGIFITGMRNEASHLSSQIYKHNLTKKLFVAAILKFPLFTKKKDAWPVGKVQHEFQRIVESIVTVAGAFSCAQSFTMTMAIQ